ncbi:hypothetical protein ACFU7Y_29620 [Kitasatospora sp. NPDC057542]|uniref:hypothetical protein n=1 Tax=Streptomycetaceae TaxID=2062 RepID=UPI001CCB18EB|nr:hypothetical protein [Streptomyces sp. LS1784]
MAQRKHLEQAKEYTEQAKTAVDKVTDPGHRAIALALLALTEAVLETGFDVDRVGTEVNKLRDDVRDVLAER